eukprot:TRINITY_DN2084_c0_g1_i3.p1 TRINITY_DN2084_c0_g1~~TRINITY_DN2084_c0_g1_i3.p1  ORF type:complete len:189 (-),score=14.86 TRINITY_DN2084_c0_g1_i3:1691-2257(-)
MDSVDTAAVPPSTMDSGEIPTPAHMTKMVSPRSFSSYRHPHPDGRITVVYIGTPLRHLSRGGSSAAFVSTALAPLCAICGGCQALGHALRIHHPGSPRMKSRPSPGNVPSRTHTPNQLLECIQRLDEHQLLGQAYEVGEAPPVEGSLHGTPCVRVLNCCHVVDAGSVSHGRRNANAFEWHAYRVQHHH